MNATATVSTIDERRHAASRLQLQQRIRAEFQEMPCLRLTCGQAQRLFGMQPDVCERVLAALVREGTLTRGADARYGVRADMACHGRLYGAADQDRTGSTAC